MPGGFEALHPSLALTRRPMRVFTAVIGVATLTVFHAGQDLPFGRAVALQFVRDDDPRYVLTSFEQLVEELLGSLLVAPTLHQDVQNIVVLIHRPPQVMAFAIHRQ